MLRFLLPRRYGLTVGAAAAAAHAWIILLLSTKVYAFSGLGTPCANSLLCISQQQQLSVTNSIPIPIPIRPFRFSNRSWQRRRSILSSHENDINGKEINEEEQPYSSLSSHYEHDNENDSSNGGNDEIIARRIFVKGNIGGYYRQCVVNEAGRFRNLVGTMTPPDRDFNTDTDTGGSARTTTGSSSSSSSSETAEIYVEGMRHRVEGFLRWCAKRNNVGLNQVVHVVEIREEDPTGLYDAFYAKVR